ncbi:MAG: winged helix-turn-helix domain-containing protein [Dehalococcoidia bacterium]|nr:winged helix-turn-helix domain-containing protein [Dehalococcoidia bacterium]
MVIPTDDITGTDLLQTLTALAHPQRLRIVAALAEGRNYVSQLARDMRMSRPLLHMHLARLEAAGLVRSEMEVSDDGKAMRYVELAPFSVHVTPEVIAGAVAQGLDSTQAEE